MNGVCVNLLGAGFLQRQAAKQAQLAGRCHHHRQSISSEPGQHRKLEDPCPLSGRELRVLQHLSEGSVYKEIALELGLSASTVRSHLNKIYLKLGARDRAQAVLTASRRGWL